MRRDAALSRRIFVASFSKFIRLYQCPLGAEARTKMKTKDPAKATVVPYALKSGEGWGGFIANAEQEGKLVTVPEGGSQLPGGVS
jgi:hypothetical protein